MIISFICRAVPIFQTFDFVYLQIRFLKDILPDCLLVGQIIGSCVNLAGETMAAILANSYGLSTVYRVKASRLLLTSSDKRLKKFFDKINPEINFVNV